MTPEDQHHRSILKRLAHQVLLERGLLPEYSPAVLDELERIHSPASVDG